jgi:hypothetical protein|tara:strand:+ start:47 stop:466 length:420 start_codon:yes stop_codon:yes gene_type:complete
MTELNSLNNKNTNNENTNNIEYSEKDWDLLVGNDSTDPNNDKDVLKFIPKNGDGKRFHILATIELMRKVVESDNELNGLFKKLLDKVCHTAPEILDIRWKDIYHFCLRNFGNIDDEEGYSRKILLIYNSRIKQYNTLFK